PWLLAFQPRQRPELELPANGGGRPAAGARRAPARRPARADASPGPGPVGPGRPLSAAVRTAGPAGHAPAGGGHGHRTGSGGLPVAPDRPDGRAGHRRAVSQRPGTERRRLPAGGHGGSGGVRQCPLRAITQHSAEELQGRSLAEFPALASLPELTRAALRQKPDNDSWEVEFRSQRRHSLEPYWGHLWISRVRDAQGATTHLLGLYRKST